MLCFKNGSPATPSASPVSHADLAQPTLERPFTSKLRLVILTARPFRRLPDARICRHEHAITA